jgi:hypothetical protein
MKKMILAFVAVAVSAVLGLAEARAGEIDFLVNKLVEKGVISPLEGQIIVDETQYAVAADIAAGKVGTLPSWIQTIKMKGDFRARYQAQKKDGSDSRERGRIRFRLGGSSRVTDNVMVGFGLATGGVDQRSTNETLDNTFETPDIRLDYAYGSVKDVLGLGDVYLGKFPRSDVIWTPSDLMWDGDINPDGAGVTIARSFGSRLDLFCNTAYLMLDESSSEPSDCGMSFFQPGFIWEIVDGISLKGAVAYYDAHGVKGERLANSTEQSAGTNTGLSVSGSTISGNLIYDYDILNPAAELGISIATLKGLEDYAVNYVGLFGEYIQNQDPDDKENGYIVGVKVGDKKVKGQGDWQVKGSYRKLEKDALLDVLPDSDFYSGKTGVKGYEAVIEYGLKKNLILGLDYYKTENITTAAPIEEELFQVDLVFKF